uniref:Uncharacterized protein n=1 Tax=Oryza barthii TaxID=65489 RepID=A0A0D3HN85_9ORYZ
MKSYSLVELALCSLIASETEEMCVSGCIIELELYGLLALEAEEETRQRPSRLERLGGAMRNDCLLELELCSILASSTRRAHY